MQVSQITGKNAHEVAQVAEAIAKRAREGGFVSLVFIAEEPGKRRSTQGIVGRFRADPYKAIGELVVLKEKLAGYAAEQDSGFSESIV